MYADGVCKFADTVCLHWIHGRLLSYTFFIKVELFDGFIISLCSSLVNYYSEKVLIYEQILGIVFFSIVWYNEANDGCGYAERGEEI